MSYKCGICESEYSIKEIYAEDAPSFCPYCGERDLETDVEDDEDE